MELYISSFPPFPFVTLSHSSIINQIVIRFIRFGSIGPRAFRFANHQIPLNSVLFTLYSRRSRSVPSKEDAAAAGQ